MQVFQKHESFVLKLRKPLLFDKKGSSEINRNIFMQNVFINDFN